MLVCDGEAPALQRGRGARVVAAELRGGLGQRDLCQKEQRKQQWKQQKQKQKHQ